LKQASAPKSDCRLCPRLADHRDALRLQFPEYHNAPVAAFGDPRPALLIIGLAPGLHGANATGRPFTGDFAGVLLYQSLFDVGVSSRPISESADDDLVLSGVRITNAVKCLPPQNKPTTAEANTCRGFLQQELSTLSSVRVILALGTVAHRATVLAAGGRVSDFPFKHGAEHELPDGRRLVDSYHCSRYNTQTRRLSAGMFVKVLDRARRLAAGSES
jgi:uracil-DNA glycosylase family 4